MWRRVTILKSAVLSFSATTLPPSSAALARAETFSHTVQRMRCRFSAAAMSCSNVVSAEMPLAASRGSTVRVSSALAKRQSHRPCEPKWADSSLGLRRRMSPILTIPSRANASAEALPTPGRQRDGAVAQEVDRLGAADDRKAARLVEVGGDFGQEFVEAEANRHGDLQLVFDALGEGCERLSGGVFVQTFGAGEIEERFVEGERFDERRRFEHQLFHLAADGDIFLHVGANDHGVRAGLERLEHRHRRLHAVGARDVAGRGDDAALAAADDDGLVHQARVVAFLDGGVEGVAVDVGERQLVDFAVVDEARAFAFGAAARLAGLR